MSPKKRRTEGGTKMSPKQRRAGGGQNCPLDREESEGDKIVS